MLKILLFVSLHESHVGSVDFQTDLDEKSQKSGEKCKETALFGFKCSYINSLLQQF
jgi:hypothetical protein